VSLGDEVGCTLPVLRVLTGENNVIVRLAENTNQTADVEFFGSIYQCRGGLFWVIKALNTADRTCSFAHCRVLGGD
jgi:hypothetical protein